MALNVSHFIWNLNIWQNEMLCHFYIRIHQGVVCYVPRSTLTCIFSKYTSAHSTNVSYLFLFLAVTFYLYTYLLLFFFRINGAKSEKIIVHWEKSLNLASDLHNLGAFLTWLNHKWITWNKAQEKFEFPKRQIFATICSKSIKTCLNWLSLLFVWGQHGVLHALLRFYKHTKHES